MPSHGSLVTLRVSVACRDLAGQPRRPFLLQCAADRGGRPAAGHTVSVAGCVRVLRVRICVCCVCVCGCSGCCMCVCAGGGVVGCTGVEGGLQAQADERLWGRRTRGTAPRRYPITAPCPAHRGFVDVAPRPGFDSASAAAMSNFTALVVSGRREGWSWSWRGGAGGTGMGWACDRVSTRLAAVGKAAAWSWSYGAQSPVWLAPPPPPPAPLMPACRLHLLLLLPLLLLLLLLLLPARPTSALHTCEFITPSLTRMAPPRSPRPPPSPAPPPRCGTWRSAWRSRPRRRTTSCSR